MEKIGSTFLSWTLEVIKLLILYAVWYLFVLLATYIYICVCVHDEDHVFKSRLCEWLFMKITC